MRAIAFILAASLSIASASAEPFAVPPDRATTSNVNVVNDPIHNSYERRETNVSCTSSTCNLIFPNVTQDRVVITHVSCMISLQSGAGVVSALLTTNNNGASNLLQIFSGAVVAGVYFAGTNSDVYLFVNKGDAAKINIETTGTAGASDCTISGYHT
jgi:hypothetical protein